MRRLRIALGVLLGLLVVGVTVIGLLVGRGISSLSRPLPPPSAYARSTPVQRADGAATRWQDGEFSGLARRAPWLAAAGRSVLDVCLAEGGAGLFGGTAPEYSCSRTDSRYYTYGGSDQAHEMGALGPPASRQRAAYLERSASSQQQIARHLTAARPHLLIVLIDVNYATKPLGHP